MCHKDICTWACRFVLWNKWITSNGSHFENCVFFSLYFFSRTNLQQPYSQMSFSKLSAKMPCFYQQRYPLHIPQYICPIYIIQPTNLQCCLTCIPCYLKTRDTSITHGNKTCIITYTRCFLYKHHPCKGSTFLGLLLQYEWMPLMITNNKLLHVHMIASGPNVDTTTC